MMMQEININYKTTKKEYITHQLRSHLTDVNRAIILALIIGFILIVIRSRFDEVPIWLFIIMLLTPVILLYGISLLINLYRASRNYEKTPHLGNSINISFTIEGMSSKSSLSSSEINWQNIVPIKKKFNFLKFYVGPKSAINVPIRAFEYDPYENFKNLINENSFINNNL
jgi:hypothetical protein